MATVIFDFDSTLIPCESLEEILKNKQLTASQVDEVKSLTNQGMAGTISFLTSFEKRIGMAEVTRQDFISFGQKAKNLLTPKIKELIAHLQDRLDEIWIVSGTAPEAIIPVGKLLGIPLNRILALELVWSPSGVYKGLDKRHPNNRAKWEGAKEAAAHWPRPAIGVGDAMTDYALFEKGLVDHFIAFTQNARREALIEKKVPEAKTVEELETLLNKVILK